MVYDGYLKQWFKYDDIWRAIPDAVAEQRIARIMDTQFPTGYQISQFKGTYNFMQIRQAVISEDRDGYKLDNWMVDKHLLPMKNGVLNLQTKELLPHKPELYMNWMLPHKYLSERTEYPIIAEFLNSLAGGNSATVQTLLCYLAAVLRGMSKCQKFLEIIGTPGTGKSTFIKLACELVGDANLTTTSMEQLQRNQFETANLYGKRLAIITDADKYGGSVEIFKSATGQDPLRFERKNQQQGKSFIYQGLIIVAANQPVQYRDQSTAMMRRRVPVHIDHRLDERDRDPELSAKMTNEIPGLIRDLIDLPEEHIEAVLTDKQKVRVDSGRRSLVETNPVAGWLNDCVVVNEDCEAKVGSAKRDGNKVLNSDIWLYASYVEWMLNRTMKPHALNTFRRTVDELLQNIDVKVYNRRKSTGSYIVGIRLREDADSEVPPMIIDSEKV